MYTAKIVSQWYVQMATASNDRLSLRYQLALSFIFQYSQIKDEIPPHGMALSTVIREVQKREGENAASLQAPPSPTCTAKIDVPALKEFKGTDEDAYGWIQDTSNTMGRAGLSLYLTEKSVCQKRPEMQREFFTPFGKLRWTVLPSMSHRTWWVTRPLVPLIYGKV